MDRFGGTVAPLCNVDIAGLVGWISSIPLGQWPQGERMVKDYPYPAMVSNGQWNNFHEVASPLISDVMSRYFPELVADHRMLSIVVPGQKIARHDDIQSGTWRVRVHVPLVSNDAALMFYDDEQAFHLEPGYAYLVNTELPHWLSNLGDQPRIHLFWDCRSPE